MPIVSAQNIGALLQKSMCVPVSWRPSSTPSRAARKTITASSGSTMRRAPGVARRILRTTKARKISTNANKIRSKTRRISCMSTQATWVYGTAQVGQSQTIGS